VKTVTVDKGCSRRGDPLTLEMKIDYCTSDGHIVVTWLWLIAFAMLYAALILGIQSARTTLRFRT
jgi:hypothetical protein